MKAKNVNTLADILLSHCSLTMNGCMCDAKERVSLDGYSLKRKRDEKSTNMEVK